MSLQNSQADKNEFVTGKEVEGVGGRIVFHEKSLAIAVSSLTNSIQCIGQLKCDLTG